MFFSAKSTCSLQINYLSLDDFLPAIEKRRWLKSHSLQKLAKTMVNLKKLIHPNEQGLWLNQPTKELGRLLTDCQQGSENKGKVMRRFLNCILWGL
ncbi:MAG: hypothetical protein R3E08_11030 [Thiotrichaceae bacterium]